MKARTDLTVYAKVRTAGFGFFHDDLVCIQFFAVGSRSPIVVESKRHSANGRCEVDVQNGGGWVVNANAGDCWGVH